MAHQFKVGDTVRQRPPQIPDPQDLSGKNMIPSTAPTIKGVVRDILTEPHYDPGESEPLYKVCVDWDDNTACNQWVRQETLIVSKHRAHEPMKPPTQDERIRTIGRVPAGSA